MNEEIVPREEKMAELVVFRLKKEKYAVNMLSVQEIIPVGYLTCVPRTPAFIKGIINLEGKIIPVIDLKKRFFFSREGILTGDERIIVVENKGAVMGIIVDGVTRVLRLPAAQIKPPEPPFLTDEGICAGLIYRAGPLHDRIIRLLDLDSIFGAIRKDHIAWQAGFKRPDLNGALANQKNFVPA